MINQISTSYHEKYFDLFFLLIERWNQVDQIIVNILYFCKYSTEVLVGL